MTCHQVQTNLSLYLYGELDFATEEKIEQHLDECSLCQNALAREKSWHTVVNSESMDVPLELLSQCRRDLRTAISSSDVTRKPRIKWWNSGQPFGFFATRWSARVALATFLVFVGFSAARWLDRNGVPGGIEISGTNQMGLLDPGSARIRDIQSDGNQHVRIIVDRIRQQEIAGRVDDQDVRQWLLAAMRDPADPGIRVDSVEVLQGQGGSDIRDALLYSIRHDSNAAVRLKALESLRLFAGDPAARETLRFVLEHDRDPGVRSEAIDILAPLSESIEFSPALAGTLQQIVRSEQNDDYVRMRCLQVLGKMNASFDVY